VSKQKKEALLDHLFFCFVALTGASDCLAITLEGFDTGFVVSFSGHTPAE
jgi:hypothetical protein